MPKQLGYRRHQLPILRYTIWSLVAVLAIGAFGSVTPYVFLLVGRIHPNDWGQFSNEGQAYGGVASVIGMIAIVGVVASLILQVRESAANRVQLNRTFHSELVYKSLEDPDLLECWGIQNGDIAKLKKAGYINLIVSYWHAMFEIGRMTDDDLRASAAEIFAAMPARDYWPTARPRWVQFQPGNTNRRFIAIIDDEYRRAADRGSVSDQPEHQTLARRIDGERPMINGLAIGTACGAAITGAVAVILHRSRAT
jgi:hypothetical protein